MLNTFLHSSFKSGSVDLILLTNLAVDVNELMNNSDLWMWPIILVTFGGA